jgi:Na+-driven multidrug efflux pump
MALSTAVTPFVGQNFGAHETQRVREAVRFCIRSCLAYGLAIAAVYALAGSSIALAFSDDASVVEIVVSYLWILPITYGAYGAALIINSVYNAMDRPLRSSSLIVARLFLLTLPGAYLGAHLGGLQGVFIGLACANLGIGLLAFWSVHNYLSTAMADLHRDGRPSHGHGSQR